MRQTQVPLIRDDMLVLVAEALLTLMTSGGQLRIASLM